ncbi:hypothetical protein PQX77_020904 [Marasmius sp. AFHP31]|nr:hypothetical protein PQX77_020904 [Marasmius sp. AFHP31]
MSIPSNFRNAQHTTIGDNANLQAVAGDLTITTNNNYHSLERDVITINGRTIRRVLDGDVILRRLLSSKILLINIQPEGTLSTESLSQVFKVKKTVQTAKIIGRREKFTAITLELITEKDRDKFVRFVKNVLEAAMCQRSTLLTQMFAVAESNGLTLIAHDELANGLEFARRYGNNWIVLYYLDYAYNVTIDFLRNDETVRFPVADRTEDWSFNVKSLTWQFDPASVLLNPPSERDLELFHNPPTPLHQEILPQLDTAEIVACVEESFGDVLHLLAQHGQRWICDLSKLAHHRLLTFGAVIDYNKRGILAYLPSIPSPEWFCKSLNPDVKVTFSSSVPWRVDLLFCKTSNVQVILVFGCRIPQKQRNQLRCVYLCQSLSFCDNSDDVEDVVFINEIGFYLKGAFHDDPTTCSTPAHLFVPPLLTEIINDTHHICYPLPEKLFYWSHDPQGRTAVVEEDWEKFGIPEFRVQKWIGSYWIENEWRYVRDYLQSGDYGPDGKQYARDHGYPELIHADPRNNAIEEIIYSDDPDSDSKCSDSGLKTFNSDFENSGEDRDISPSHPLPLPSPSSLAEASTKCDTKHEDGKLAQPVSHWAKPVFVKWYNSVLATLAEADGLDHSIVAC